MDISKRAAEIARAMAAVFTEHSLVIEGAAAVGIAALSAGKVDVSGKRVAVVFSGSSIDTALYLSVLNSYVSKVKE